MKIDSFTWMFAQKRPIIHRGVIDRTCIEHTRKAFLSCIEQRYPMEVDLLMLRDQQIVVWRDEIIDETNEGGGWLSSMSLPEIRNNSRYVADLRLSQMMTLEEFVSMVNGKVSVIFELKVPYGSSPNDLVDSVLSILTKYRGAFAIHSSNPYAIHRIHAHCPDIPIGQISLSFKGIPDVDPNFIRLHREFLFADILVPDFLNYDIRDLSDEDTRHRVLVFCHKHDIPLLSWTIKNASEEHLARKYCNNYIIEGNVSYM